MAAAREIKAKLAPAPPGQDRGVARRRAFLEAARAVFLEQGYEAASVNDVVRRAGGSLATLYAQYGSKEGLFEAVTIDQHERFAAAITPERVDHLELEPGLRAIGEHFLRALLEPDNLAFYRIIIGEGRKFPQLLRRYAAAGAIGIRTVLVDFLRARGVVVADYDLAAAQLISLWRANRHYVALADETHRISEAELKRHIAAGVDLFLNGVRRVT